MPTFDPCPLSLAVGRVASWKCADRIPGAWPDLSGNYSLTNHNTVQMRRASEGRTTVGPGTLCDWQALEAWSTTHTDLLRNGQSWTKCGVISTAYPDFDAQVAIICGLYSNDSGGNIDMGMTRTGGGLSFWLHASPAGTSGAMTRTDSVNGLTFFAARYNHSAPVITYDYLSLSDGGLLNQRVYSNTLGDRTQEFYGRRGTGSNATYNGSQTIIDCIQVFDSVLSDSDLQLICSHIWSQRELVGAYLRGMSA